MIGNVASYFEPGWELWRKTFDEDATGGTIEVLTKIADITGRLRPQSGDLKLSANRDTEFNKYRFYTLTAGAQSGDQLRKDGAVYDILHVADVMTFAKFYHIDCEAVI